MSATPSEAPKAMHASSHRQRLMRMLNAVSRRPTDTELTELDVLLKRASPDRVAGSSRFIGMNALTLTSRTLKSVGPNGFIFNKVNGIGALAAMFNPGNKSKSSNSTAIASYTMLLVRRNGIIAVDNVPVPLRTGRVLMDGEICIRRKLTQGEKATLKTMRCVVGFTYLEPDDGNPESDDDHELCYAAHDLIVDDNASLSNVKLRGADAVCLQEPADRFARLLAITQCPPICDERSEDVIAQTVADFQKSGRRPSINVFCKTPFLDKDFNLALLMLPECMRGIELDGLIFMPGRGPYLVGQTNVDLLKYKAWRDNTADLVFVKGANSAGDEVYRFFIVDSNNEARCISERLWMGDTDEERAATRMALDMEAARLANGGHANTPYIFECEPSVADSEQFYALAQAEFPDEPARLHAAGKLLKWRPIGVMREDKLYPNSAINFWTIVDALLNCVTVQDIARHLSQFTNKYQNV